MESTLTVAVGVERQPWPNGVALSFSAIARAYDKPVAKSVFGTIKQTRHHPGQLQIGQSFGTLAAVVTKNLPKDRAASGKGLAAHDGEVHE